MRAGFCLNQILIGVYEHGIARQNCYCLTKFLVNRRHPSSQRCAIHDIIVNKGEVVKQLYRDCLRYRLMCIFPQTFHMPASTIPRRMRLPVTSKNISEGFIQIGRLTIEVLHPQLHLKQSLKFFCAMH